MQMTAAGLYGAPRAPQPPAAGEAPSADGAQANGTRTEKRDTSALGNPVTWLVGLIGLALLLIISVRLEVSIDA